jgi:uncharacterized membrane protein
MPRATAGVFKALALLACIVVPWLAYLAVSRDLAGPLLWALAVPHAAIYVFLLWWFGRTLLPGREPLITGIARRVHGALAPGIEAYTRKVTLAWCGFFAAQIITSGLLLILASPGVWSLFVNVLNLPLVGLMLAGEYWYRVMRYPDHPRASIATALRAIAGQDAAITSAKAR